MKLIFKQKMFSWFDSYDVYSESGTSLYTVKGQLSWGHCLKIFDNSGVEVGTVKQKLLTFLPAFEIYIGDKYLGSIKREFAFFKPKYNIDFNGWHVEGNLFEWDYTIVDRNGKQVAYVSKELFNWTDTYTIDVLNPEEAVYALMLVIAIDAEKCSRDN